MFLAIKRGNGIAGRSNAKPLFLLSVIECISLHKLNENKIMWDDEEIEKSYHAFARYYEQDNKSSIIVPYYHLSTAPFFHLVWIDEKNRPPMNRKPLLKNILGKTLFVHILMMNYGNYLMTQNVENFCVEILLKDS